MPGAALLQLAGVYRVRSGEAGHRVATVTIGGFLSRIAETIAAMPPPDRTGGTQVPAETALRP